MDTRTRTHLANLRAHDGDTRYAAYQYILNATDQPVDWAYEAWDALLSDLSHQHNHIRTIAAQVLANLAKSDPKHRMLKDFDQLLAVTRDEKFVTARHTLQALWKVGAVSPRHRRLVMDRLAGRFAECATEKNCTLIRYDILDGLRKLYDVTADETVRARALGLIEIEPDPKYRKKYASLWRPARTPKAAA